MRSISDREWINALRGQDARFSIAVIICVCGRAEADIVSRTIFMCKYIMQEKDLRCCVMSSIQAGRDMKKILCRFYKNGSCIYGSSCRYDHIPQTWVFRNLEKVGFPIDNEASKGEPETAASHVDLNDRTQTSASTAQSHNDVPANVETVVENGAREEILCGYYVLGNCPFGENCKYVHGDMCELCKRQILRPGDDAYKLMHQQSRNSN
ncbi:E3 ubiquitin-protein ligase [Trichinella pseudospiralis]